MVTHTDLNLKTGAKNDDNILAGTSDIGSTGNVVVWLTQAVPIFINHIIYFDNFYYFLTLLRQDRRLPMNFGEWTKKKHIADLEFVFWSWHYLWNWNS